MILGLWIENHMKIMHVYLIFSSEKNVIAVVTEMAMKTEQKWNLVITRKEQKLG